MKNRLTIVYDGELDSMGFAWVMAVIARQASQGFLYGLDRTECGKYQYHIETFETSAQHATQHSLPFVEV